MVLYEIVSLKCNSGLCFYANWESYLQKVTQVKTSEFLRNQPGLSGRDINVPPPQCPTGNEQDTAGCSPKEPVLWSDSPSSRRVPPKLPCRENAVG